MSVKGNRLKKYSETVDKLKCVKGGIFKSVGKESTRRKGGNIDKKDRTLV